MSVTSQEADAIVEQTLLETRIDKIYQKLFWYDNVPSDEEMVALIMEWRAHRQKLKDLKVNSRYTS